MKIRCAVCREERNINDLDLLKLKHQHTEFNIAFCFDDTYCFLEAKRILTKDYFDLLEIEGDVVCR
jgi:hypothetical protein